jgi:hypothetical protein
MPHIPRIVENGRRHFGAKAGCGAWEHPDITAQIDQLKVLYPNLLISVILPATGKAPARCEALASAGAEILHLNADNHAQDLMMSRKSISRI